VVTDAEIEPRNVVKVGCDAPDIELLFVEAQRRDL
jgi:hypothetical protein